MSEDPEYNALEREKLGDRLEIVARKAQITGTRRDSFVDSPSLCNTCRWAQITRRASRNNRMIECSSLSRIVPEDIVECSSYSSHTALSIGQMAEMAILIDNVPPKRVGFHRGDK